MSDDFESLFHRLRGQRPPHPFAVPEAIRRRGRQRSQHQALAAGLTVVALAAGTGWAATFGPVDRSTDPGPASITTAPASPSPSPLPTRTPPRSPAPSATTGPSATALPGPGDLSSRMLRPADLGPGSWRPRPPVDSFDGPDLWHWTSACPAYDSADYPSLRRQEDLDVTGFATGTTMDSPYVFEHVHRYAVGWGPRALDDVSRAVPVCVDAPQAIRRSIVATGFAGDEALLIREEFPAVGAEPFVTLAAVVRVGDLVATVLFSPDRDEQYARNVAAAAANRLAGR
ncbi:MAG TPA: hypothetical protein VHN18_14600 [Micromonosporaceae bacterium]|nr:hypothetical protein [Micromonosporaceae bacterium]